MHVTQRGVNRCAIFIDDIDRAHYLQVLQQALRADSIQLHAYVLMDNHVHLLLTTRAAGDLTRAMHRVGHGYVAAFNGRHGRVGALWQGRFKACAIDSDAYLFTVMRYIELNPVRAGMCERPEDHRWSSVHVHLGVRNDPLIAFHPQYLSLGANLSERHETWRRWLGQGVSDVDLAAIRRHLARQAALGDQRFQEMVARTLNRPVACRPRGRPASGWRRVNAETNSSESD
jgi:putative transposase